MQLARCETSGVDWVTRLPHDYSPCASAPSSYRPRSACRLRLRGARETARNKRRPDLAGEVKPTLPIPTLNSSSSWCPRRRWDSGARRSDSDFLLQFTPPGQRSPTVMAGGSSEDRWRRPTSRCHADPRDDEPEEGEVVPGYHSDVDTEEYYNRHSCSSSDSDETISDSNAACSVPPKYGEDTSPCSVAANSAGSSSPVAARAALACPVCGKEFRSQKAVCGHMKVHAIGTHEQGIGEGKGIKRDVASLASWGGTGKRGCSGLGGRAAASTNAESYQSVAIVVAEPKIVLQPKPLAFATPIRNAHSVVRAHDVVNGNAQAQSVVCVHGVRIAQSVARARGVCNDQCFRPEQQRSVAMDAVVAGPANQPSEAVVHPHAAPPTPPAAGEQSPSSIQRHPTARPPPPPAAGRQNPNGYTCKECNEWFPMHQGLGGHVAAHRSREVAAAAEGTLEDGAVACRRNAKPEKAHVCKVCGAAFPGGVQLGGHMRKHYAGPPIVPNKKRRLVQPPVPPPALTLALPASAYADGASPAPAVDAAAQPGPAPAVERTPEPAPGPAVAGRMLLFGVDIGVRVQKPAAQEGPSATEGPASTGGEQ
ncbi:hypothetical protein PAHAL_5G222300 [Panicum hallii]|uniref:C2H2-type domain-containing protein n=1 Tax=Panicum hallii TaxID=206008 RepID=A0A2T8IKU7_9POAL|nr:hypothetical protein PAHAL_5G222300 [Panicum hallii]